MKQKCFAGCHPQRPTIRTPHVAEKIARRIVAAVNTDEFYWAADEIEDRVWDIQQELVRRGRPRTVFLRLEHLQRLGAYSRDRVTRPYGWEGIDEHCRDIGDTIAATVLAKAITTWEREY